MLLTGVGNNIITSSFDSDAAAFFTAASITDAGQKTAINNLVLAMKSASVWTKMVGCYPIVGGTSTSHAVNLKTPGTFNLTFTGSPTHSSTGVDWNGTSQYASTGIIPNTHLTAAAKSLGYYSREDSAASTACEIGCNGTGGGTFDGIFLKVAGNLFTGYLTDASGVNVANANAQGFYIISRSNTTQVNFYKNGAALGTNPKSMASGAQNTTQIEIGRGNAQYSNRQCAFAFVASDMSSTNASDLYTAVQAYQTALSRQV